MFRRGIAIILISLSLYGLALILGHTLATGAGMDGFTVIRMSIMMLSCITGIIILYEPKNKDRKKG